MRLHEHFNLFVHPPGDSGSPPPADRPSAGAPAPSGDAFRHHRPGAWHDGGRGTLSLNGQSPAASLYRVAKNQRIRCGRRRDPDPVDSPSNLTHRLNKRFDPVVARIGSAETSADGIPDVIKVPAASDYGTSPHFCPPDAISIAGMSTPRHEEPERSLSLSSSTIDDLFAPPVDAGRMRCGSRRPSSAIMTIACGAEAYIASRLLVPAHSFPGNSQAVNLCLTARTLPGDPQTALSLLRI